MQTIEDKLYPTLSSLKKKENFEDIVKVLDKLDMADDLGIESIFSDNKFHLDRFLKLNHAS